MRRGKVAVNSKQKKMHRKTELYMAKTQAKKDDAQANTEETKARNEETKDDTSSRNAMTDAKLEITSQKSQKEPPKKRQKKKPKKKQHSETSKIRLRKSRQFFGVFFFYCILSEKRKQVWKKSRAADIKFRRTKIKRSRRGKMKRNEMGTGEKKETEKLGGDEEDASPLFMERNSMMARKELLPVI